MATRNRKAAVRASFREWWPELLCGAILAAAGFAGQKDDPLFAIFEGLVVAVAWAMGHRHRRLPMQATLDGVRQDVSGVRDDVGEIRETMHAAVAALTEEPPQPGLRLVP